MIAPIIGSRLTRFVGIKLTFSGVGSSLFKTPKLWTAGVRGHRLTSRTKLCVWRADVFSGLLSVAVVGNVGKLSIVFSNLNACSPGQCITEDIHESLVYNRNS